MTCYTTYNSTDMLCVTVICLQIKVTAINM